MRGGGAASRPTSRVDLATKLAGLNAALATGRAHAGTAFGDQNYGEKGSYDCNPAPEHGRAEGTEDGIDGEVSHRSGAQQGDWRMHAGIVR